VAPSGGQRRNKRIKSVGREERRLFERSETLDPSSTLKTLRKKRGWDVPAGGGLKTKVSGQSRDKA